MTSRLEEVVRIEGDDTRLVRLGDVGEDAVDHTDEHSVLVRVSGVFDNRNNIRSRLGDVQQVPAGTVRELDSVDESFGTDDVGNVGHSRSRSGSQVKNLLARGDVNFVDTAENSSSQL